MKRVVAALTVAALGGAAAVPLLPRDAGASSAVCSQPSISEMDVGGTPQQHGAVGAGVTLKGSGLNSIGCTTSVTINGGSVSNLQVSASQLNFTVSQALSGVVQVKLTDSSNNSNVDNNQLIYITDPTGSTLSTVSPVTGATDQLVGNNFNFNLGSGQEQYSATYQWGSNGSGGNCPGLPGPPSLADPQHINVPMPTQYCDGRVTVTLSAPCSNTGAACSGSTATRMSFALAATFDIAAHVTGLSGSGVAGSTESVNGSGFGSSMGSVSVNGVGTSVTSWKDTAVSFTVPAAATSGTVRVTRPYDGNQFSAGNLSVTATVSGLSQGKAAVGDTLSVNGAGFGTQQGTVSVNSTSASISSWSPTSIAFSVPDGATTGPVVVTTNGTNSPASTPTLTVVPKVTGITPAHAQAGSLIEVDGTTFGTQQGTVQVGGEAGQVTLWGDKQVLVSLPGDLRTGATTVTVSPPGTDSASAPFSIDAPPPPTASPTNPSSSSSSSGSSSSANSSASATPGIIQPNPAGPVIAHGPVAFVRPTPPPGPVSLRLDSAANQTDPGGSVKFTVTLIAFGKPVVGAPVDLLLVIEPGSDATIDPMHAVTDASGKVTGTIRLSKTAGDHIVLARSGIYSDEIRVVGRSATNAVATANQSGGGANPAATPPFLAVRSPVLWALISCLLLFGLGFGLNLMTSPAVAGAGSGGAAAAEDDRRRDLVGSMLAGMSVAREAIGAVAGLIAAAGAHAVGALRRGRS